jgi:hypothetical protein
MSYMKPHSLAVRDVTVTPFCVFRQLFGNRSLWTQSLNHPTEALVQFCKEIYYKQPCYCYVLHSVLFDTFSVTEVFGL